MDIFLFWLRLQCREYIRQYRNILQDWQEERITVSDRDFYLDDLMRESDECMEILNNLGLGRR